MSERAATAAWRGAARCAPRWEATLGLLVTLGACAAPPPPASEPARQRLAVLAPAAAETLAALGVGDRVVAVGDWVTWPPELAARPKLGAYDAPSRERLLELRVDTLITTASAAGQAGRAELPALGIEVVELETETLAGNLTSILGLGRLVGREAAARQLVDDIQRRIDEVAARAAGVPRRRVLVVVGREPLYVAGPGSFLDDLVRAAGGENVAADAGAPWAQVSIEAMLARRPEVILDSADNRPGALRGAEVGSWGRWPFVPAVADRRVYHLDPTRMTVQGPRLAAIAERLGRLIHPEQFGSPVPDDFAGGAPAAGDK